MVATSVQIGRRRSRAGAPGRSRRLRIGAALLLVATGIALASQSWALAAPLSAGLLAFGALLAAVEILLLLREERRT